MEEGSLSFQGPVCARSLGGVSPPQQSPSCPLSPDPCGEDTVDPPCSANHGLATRGVVLTHLPQDGALLGLKGPAPPDQTDRHMLGQLWGPGVIRGHGWRLVEEPSCPRPLGPLGCLLHGQAVCAVCRAWAPEQPQRQLGLRL